MPDQKPKFKPNDEVLTPIVELYEKFAVIDEEIVRESAIAFKEFPPDEDLKNLLDAVEG